jgi:ABC-type Fe3+/spermidine/putrescine transport system ATPase subunit
MNAAISTNNGTESVLRTENLNIYYGNFLALQNVWLDIPKNQVTAFIGPSGCGKSTLLRCYNRLNDLIESFRAEGKVYFYDKNLYAPDIDAVEVRRRIGMVFQKPNPFPKSIYNTLDCLECVIKDNKDAIILDFFAGSGTTGHAVSLINKADNGNRQFILIEQGEYFDIVTKPRIQKIVFSNEWRDGKPVEPETGISFCFKVLKLESYEDSLTNLQLRRSAAQGDLEGAEAQDAIRAEMTPAQLAEGERLSAAWRRDFAGGGSAAAKSQQ